MLSGFVLLSLGGTIIFGHLRLGQLGIGVDLIPNGIVSHAAIGRGSISGNCADYRFEVIGFANIAANSLGLRMLGESSQGVIYAKALKALVLLIGVSGRLEVSNEGILGLVGTADFVSKVRITESNW